MSLWQHHSFLAEITWKSCISCQKKRKKKKVPSPKYCLNCFCNVCVPVVITKGKKNKNSQIFWVELQTRLILKHMDNLKWKNPVFLEVWLLPLLTHIRKGMWKWITASMDNPLRKRQSWKLLSQERLLSRFLEKGNPLIFVCRLWETLKMDDFQSGKDLREATKLCSALQGRARAPPRGEGEISRSIGAIRSRTNRFCDAWDVAAGTRLAERLRLAIYSTRLLRYVSTESLLPPVVHHFSCEMG